MNGARSVVGLVNSITNDVGIMNSSYLMEMNWVSTELEGLTNVKELNVGYPCNQQATIIGMNHHVSAILILG